jgi:hypothetical protein
MISMVLVHGMFHGPWCWDRVIPLLQADDVVIATPDLSQNYMDPGPVQDVVDRSITYGFSRRRRCVSGVDSVARAQKCE